MLNIIATILIAAQDVKFWAKGKIFKSSLERHNLVMWCACNPIGVMYTSGHVREHMRMEDF